jgi:pimeloyl-ACP methyl ester carboxylesterase
MPGQWNEIEIRGHRAATFEPAVPSEHGYVLVYLHGVHLGDLRTYSEFGELFDRFGFRVLCPVTQRSWWTDKICAEFDPELSAERYMLEHVVPAIDEHWGAKPPRIALFGTSMGGQGALRLAFKHPDTFPIAAAISPAIDYHLRFEENDETLPLMYPDAESARQDTALLHIHPLYWPRNIWYCCDPIDRRWHDSAERLRMKLSALGIPHDYDLETSGGGHSFEYYSRMAPAAMEYVFERLERERRRVQ